VGPLPPVLHPSERQRQIEKAGYDVPEDLWGIGVGVHSKHLKT